MNKKSRFEQRLKDSLKKTKRIVFPGGVKYRHREGVSARGNTDSGREMVTSTAAASRARLSFGRVPSLTGRPTSVGTFSKRKQAVYLKRPVNPGWRTSSEG